MLLLYLKALHIIGFVSWFAGLFYLGRLFIYHQETNKKPEHERAVLQAQFIIMQKRLYYIICWPGMIITVVFGTWMVVINTGYLDTWLYLKLVFVAALLLYHFLCGIIMKKLIKTHSHDSAFKWTSLQLRIWNEVATLLLVAIVFIAVLKNTLGFFYGITGFILVGILLFLGIRLYKKMTKN
ncbi:MAG: CopD family protein [Cytophagales bacterium]|nr:CopD family protein [Cytophagales bacterium]